MKTDPRVKLFALLLLTTLALIFDSLWWQFGLLLAVMILAAFWGKGLAGFFRSARGFLGLVLAVALLQCLFTRSGQPLLDIGGFTLVYRDGAAAGLSAALRFLTVICAAAMLSGESSRRMIAGLSGMGLPYTLVFMLMTALRFLPLFRSSFQDAVTSVQLRGVDLRSVPWRKRMGFYGSLLLPVLAEAIERARELAVSMEARGFGAYDSRSNYYQLKMSPRDWLLVALLAAGFILALVFYFKLK